MGDAIPGIAAITCFQIAILIIDDLLDSAPHGLYRQTIAANLVSAFQAARLEAIAGSNAPQATKFLLYAYFKAVIHERLCGRLCSVGGGLNHFDSLWNVDQLLQTIGCELARIEEGLG